MGLDLYAGTFTRYYTRNWKTVVEAWAEADVYKRQDVKLPPISGEDLSVFYS